MGKSKIVYGSRIFESGDIKSGNCYLAVSLLSDSLEMNTLDFEVESDDTSLTNFVRNTPLTYYNDGEQVGIFFVQKVKRTAKTRYSFACTSAMGLLDETDHYGGIYTGETVAEVVKSICGNRVAYRVKTNLKKIALYGYLPKATCRANLSQVLFAIGAAVKSDLDGYLRIEGLWDEASGAIDEDHVYAGGSVEGDTPVTRVVVTEHQYIKGSETKTLFEGTTADGDIIVFDEPMHDLAADGFTILESGVNFAKVSTGNGTLTGTAYIHSTREVSKEVTAAEAENVVRVEDATLVSLANANAVAERLAAYYAARESVEQDVVYDGELPGDVVDMAHPYGGTVQSCIESTDITLSGRLRSTERHLVGYRPPDIGNEEYYDHAELITEDGEWVAPDGATNIRVVVIGGGSGGNCGFPGEDGSDSYGQSGSSGGKGGKGGSGGSGGKVYQKTLEVEQGQIYRIKIGAGGNGASYLVDDPAPGAPGGDTTFGELSSSMGAEGNAGFLDIFTGKTYGQIGNFGLTGGEGGSGSDYQTSGNTAAKIEKLGNPGAGGNPNIGSGGSRVKYYVSSGTGGGASGRGYAHGSPTYLGYPFNVPSGGGSGIGCGSGVTLDRYKGFVGTGNIYPGVPMELHKISSSAYVESPTKAYVYNYSYGKDSNDKMYCDYTTTVYTAAIAYEDRRYVNYYGGGGGGGAAFKADGQAGGYSETENTQKSYGGSGANALQPEQAVLYGSGGDGGNGGGGGGGAGGFKREAGQYAPSFSYEPQGGAGGSGSAGGDGKSGCVLIYYGLPKTVESGRFRTRDGRDFADNHKRQVVV